MRRVARPVVVVAALLGGAALAAGLGLLLVAPSGAAAQAGAARAHVLDRTYSCKVEAIGAGMHQFEVRAHSGIRGNAARWELLPFAVVHTGGTTGGPGTALEGSLVWVSAGRPSGETALTNRFGVVSARAHGTLAFNPSLCARIRARVPLTARGLEGGPVSWSEEEFDCVSPRRVLLRVGATSPSRIALSRDGAFLKARSALTDAYIAVRSRAGRPLAFAAVSDSGKARLFTAPACVAE